MIINIVQLIEECKKLYPCDVDVRFNEPMRERTTFKVGGPADCLVCPSGEGFALFCAGLLNRARAEGIPVFILGGGANIVVSDNGIRGIVLDTSAWKGEITPETSPEEEQIPRDEETLILKSGTTLDEAAETAAALCLSGLEFLAGMPGTIGGAVWMNARCYGKETADVLTWAEIAYREQLAHNSEYFIRKVEIEDKRILNSQFSDISCFDYKVSPFQKMDCLILKAAFKLKKGGKEKILLEMEKNRKDRRDKGHYLFPCAGSAFKNNREFGKPAGQIIDELGIKGLKIGGAQVAPFHGNIIVNTGNATAEDIRALVSEVKARVKAATAFTLETEILFVGI